MHKRAFITGITGQDGVYLAQFLLKKNYQVYGLVARRSCENHLWRLQELTCNGLTLESQVKLINGDMTDVSSLVNALKIAKADEIYNLAAQSFVGTSWAQPILTGQVTAVGVTNLLEAVRLTNPNIKFYQASSSEMFGQAKTKQQNETTPFHPCNPYGIAKLYAYWITINYRESFGIHASNGILFNHESPLRGLEFVTRKISYTVAQIALGKSSQLFLGNLDTKRDWGFAGDYVEAMWAMLQQEKAGDYIIATGETHTVAEFCRLAFEQVSLNYQDYVVINPQLFRPTEIHSLLGCPEKAKRELNWHSKTDLTTLVKMMVTADINRVNKANF